MSTDHNPANAKVPTLERIVEHGQVWPDLMEQYGVVNPTPPWKSSLDGMCDALDKEATALPLLERRDEEDLLSQGVYESLPYPESQLVSLAHPMVSRDLIAEDELTRRMEEVRARLEVMDTC